MMHPEEHALDAALFPDVWRRSVVRHGNDLDLCFDVTCRQKSCASNPLPRLPR